MKTWRVIVIDKADPKRVEQDTHLTAPELPDEPAVRAFAEANWNHLEFVRAEDVTTPEPPPPAPPPEPAPAPPVAANLPTAGEVEPA